jgi:hypothetical protein
MPKSKKRGGEKAHRKRMQKVNKVRKSTILKQQKIFQDAMIEQIEAMKKQYSGETENQETTQKNAVEPIQSTENIQL